MAITRAQQVRQMLEEGGILVSPSKDGKRPGYRNPTKERQKAEKAAQKSKDRANLREQASVAATQGRRTPTMKEVREIVNRGPDDRSSDLQTFNTYQQTGRYNPELEDMFQEDKKIFNPVEDLNLNEREKQFQKFLKFRKPVKFPNYSVFKPFENVAQKFSNFNASINRPFFEKVIRAGKIPGLSFDMTEEELEDAYQDYMSNRLSGVTDAYGNLKTGFMRTADGQIIKTGRDDDPILFPEGTTPGDPNQDPDDGDDDDNTQTGSGLALRFMSRGGSPMDAPTQGGIMMASGVLGDESDDISEEMFGKPVKDLNPSEFQELMDYLDSLDKKFSSKKGITQMASAPDPMDTRNDMMQNLAIDNFGKPLKDLTEDEIIQIEEMMDEMSGKRKAPSIKMAGGDVDPFLLREYEKYAYDMREQGREPMPLKDFIRMILAEARMGVNAGGLTTII